MARRGAWATWTLLVVAGAAAVTQPRAVPASIDVTVNEGTSMSVAVSPDGRTLALDLQGSIWTMPAAGGAATRITDIFNDARQPAWSPDGRTIAFFAYRDGGYDLWAINPDGTNQRKLTWGAFDDREPAWSRDGTKLAFSSDRGDPLGSDYNIWTLDLKDGALTQLTKEPGNDFMPSWSADGQEIAYASQRGDAQEIWAVSTTTGAQRKVSSARGRADAPSWSTGGQLVYHVTEGTQSSRLEIDGTALTGSENVFAFRPSWASATDFFYTSDGRIRRRSVNGGPAQTVEFTATLQVTPARYERRKRNFDAGVPRPALGIVRPAISPDGTRVAFAALGDIYLMPIGGAPQNLTKDRFLDTEPAWSPDGTQLVYSSDKGGNQLQLWVRDVASGRERQLTSLATQPMSAAWSPDGTRIAFLDVDGMWRRSGVSVVDVASGAVTKIHESIFAPGAPTWSPDSARVAVAMVASYSSRYREGTNQILTMSSRGREDRRQADPADGKDRRQADPAAGKDRRQADPADGKDRRQADPADSDVKWYAPVPNLSIDSRGGCGPAWSPDGSKMAMIYEGVLAVVPVSAAGQPLGPPRRLTSEIAHAPSWTADSKRILYQSNEKLKTIDIETGVTREVPVDLTYAYDVPKGRVVVHAGTLVDMKSDTPRSDVDIVIEGNRIRSVAPHSAAAHAAGRVVDAAGLTVMPGLTEFHSHMQNDFGEAQWRAWLAFGVTTVRSPGGVPYEAVEQREAIDAGSRPGPRVFNTGYLMEYQRVYYKMGIAISSPQHLEMELQRAKALQFDLLKSYVRMTDLGQRRIVEFAHTIGVPVATHEVFPSTFVGMDGTEHTAATSRRGYSPKMATLQRSYSDVSSLFGKAGTILCPMIAQGGTRKLYADNPAMRKDPRFMLYPKWIQDQVGSGAPQGPGGDGRGPGEMVMNVMKAGGKIVAGTDGPNAFNLHGELMSYVMAGMTPYQALKAATVNPAEALNMDSGTIEPGKLADLVVVEGNPLENIAAAHKVKRVIANGRVYELEDLLRGTAPKPTPTASR